MRPFIANIFKAYKRATPILTQHLYSTSSLRRSAHVVDLPSSVDWRERGAVTPIRKQTIDGTCWALATVAAVEGLVKIKTGHLINLSPQYLIDDFSKGCYGGSKDDGWEILKKRGAVTEGAYPYVGCRCLKASTNFDREKDYCVSQYLACLDKSIDFNYITINIRGFEDIPCGDEHALLKAVAHQPVVCGIQVNDNFHWYDGGIIKGSEMQEKIIKLNHSIVIVGYGEEKGTKYWIVKNFWGEEWGEEGYARMERGVGIAGIDLEASYPV